LSAKGNDWLIVKSGFASEVGGGRKTGRTFM